MDAVIRLNPDDDYAYLSRGLAHFAKGDEDLAISDLDAVLRLNPDHPVPTCCVAFYWEIGNSGSE